MQVGTRTRQKAQACASLLHKNTYLLSRVGRSRVSAQRVSTIAILHNMMENETCTLKALKVVLYIDCLHGGQSRVIEDQITENKTKQYREPKLEPEVF